MQITIDGHVMTIQPDSFSWTPPTEIGKDGVFAPIRGTFWSATLSLPLTTTPDTADWYDVFNALVHSVILPHPRNLVMTTFADVYVTITGIRMDTRGDCPYVSGVDIELTGIVVV
jgi:hypothetical protein